MGCCQDQQSKPYVSYNKQEILIQDLIKSLSFNNHSSILPYLNVIKSYFINVVLENDESSFKFLPFQNAKKLIDVIIYQINHKTDNNSTLTSRLNEEKDGKFELKSKAPSKKSEIYSDFIRKSLYSSVKDSNDTPDYYILFIINILGLFPNQIDYEVTIRLFELFQIDLEIDSFFIFIKTFIDIHVRQLTEKYMDYLKKRQKKQGDVHVLLEKEGKTDFLLREILNNDNKLMKIFNYSSLNIILNEIYQGFLEEYYEFHGRNKKILLKKEYFFKFESENVCFNENVYLNFNVDVTQTNDNKHFEYKCKYEYEYECKYNDEDDEDDEDNDENEDNNSQSSASNGRTKEKDSKFYINNQVFSKFNSRFPFLFDASNLRLYIIEKLDFISKYEEGSRLII